MRQTLLNLGFALGVVVLSSCKHGAQAAVPIPPPVVTPVTAPPPVDARCGQLANLSYQGPVIFRYSDGRGIGIGPDHDLLMLSSQPVTWTLKSGSWMDQRGYWVFNDGESPHRAWVPSSCSEPWRGKVGLYWNKDRLARGDPQDCELIHIRVQHDCVVTLQVNYQGYFLSFVDGQPWVSTTGTEFTAEFPKP